MAQVKTQQSLKDCPVGKVRNPKTKRCVKAKQENKKEKPCPEGKVRNPKTNRCVKIKDDGWNQQIEKEFRQILAELRKPKLAGAFPSSSPQKMQEICPVCIKNAKTQQLQKQIETRKKPVNILVPRKKNKT